MEQHRGSINYSIFNKKQENDEAEGKQPRGLTAGRPGKIGQMERAMERIMGHIAFRS
jgi:hypothetical protein